MSFAQNELTTPEMAAQMVEVMSSYLMVGVVRADISPFGAFSFHGQDSVLKMLELTYVDAGGKPRVLKVDSSPSQEMQFVLDAIQPVLRSAMGKLGANFHFYLYENRDEKGDRIVSPYEKAQVHARLGKLGQSAGGTLTWEFPLDSLHLPRRCEPCAKEMHITWNYCPWCGKKLPE